MGKMLEKYEKQHRRLRINGMFYASISSASFGFSPLFSLGLLAAGLSSFDILSYRWLIAGLVLLVYALCKKKSLRLNSFNETWKIVLLSLLRSITSITLLIGYANISSGIASTINFMYPVIIALCMIPQCRQADDNINDSADNTCLATEYPSNNIEFKKTDTAPVDTADNKQAQRYFIQHTKTSKKYRVF